ncbi:MAG: hypothetical protein GWO08_13965, partial [Gammaproteobacteria bacterium]|nr:hypothetical protein [Gammaproteobacteria bacterium]NIQ74034.1 hypothetical protein [Gammaproteobacteria bacterium]NIR94729.1 hypothetical protein [Gammaproteobacteria bacterium]NIV25830.1 hypothetical protein [Gammaproteobacteria bacterium]NIW10724.1 hypothetical protein [Gammaproteobacteria bacterium]
DFGNITGGNNTDIFNFTTGSITNAVDGGAGTVNDTLTYAGGPVATVTLTAIGTNDGFQGTATSLGTFDNINTLVGSSGTDSLTGINADSAWTIDVGNTYVANSRTLTFSAVEDLIGNAGADTFNINTDHAGDLSGLGGDDIFDFADAVTVTGTISGGSGSDTMDFADVVTGIIILSISNTDANGSDGDADNDTPPEDPIDKGLAADDFTGIDTFIGTAGSILIGPNTDTFYNITDTNTGTYGDSLVNIGANSFNNFQIQGGTADDTFVFQNNATAQISNDIDGGAGTDTLAGSLAADTFNITGTTSVTITPSAGVATNLTSIETIDGANATDDGTTTVGDTGNDIFNINNNWSGTLAG